MSLATEQSRDPGEGYVDVDPLVTGPSATEPEEHVCNACGTRLAEDQEWCLECGAARTIVHPAPSWRIPVAIVGGVVVLVLAAFAIALINLSNGANRSAQALPAQVSTASRQPAAPASTPAAAPALPAVAGWPSGVSGWTVELATRHRRSRALNVARLFMGSGIKAGVLNSSRHPLMTPGFWVVFSGRYPDQAAASAAAASLRAQGHRRARAVEVAAPGGI